MLIYLLSSTNDIEQLYSKAKFEFNDEFGFPPVNHISDCALIM